ncbi:MAG: hypothetical protein ACRBHB_06705 [Arenicella sp.]
MSEVQIKKIFLLIAILLSIAFFCNFAYEQNKQRTEEGLVYLSLFQPNTEVKEFDHIIAFSKPSICSSDEAHFSGFPQEALSNFLKINAEGAKPIRLSNLEKKVPIVSWSETQNIYTKGIEDFFKPKNKSLVSLSRVGFNKERNEAVACVEIYKNSLGEGILLFFEKSRDIWKITINRNIWIS